MKNFSRAIGSYKLLFNFLNFLIMKKVGYLSVKGQNFWKAYHNSRMCSIWEAYEKPSQNKIREEQICRVTMLESGGHDFRIMSYNTFQFTCGWQTASGMLRVETAQNTYLVEAIF